MQFSKILGVFALLSAASATSVSYDQGYDEAARSLTTVSCSDGDYGLMTRYGWTVQGDVSNFPYIGGSDSIPNWNSPNCGTCWSATYNGKTIYILAIDHAGQGLNIGLAAMNDLTNGRAVELGRVDAEVQQVGLDKCGL